MTDSVITWASLAAAIGVGLTLLKFYNEFNGLILASKKDADEKIDTLRSEREQAGERINTQINLIQAAFSMYREQTAKDQREFVTREMVRDLEQRIERSMRESSDRSVEAIGKLTARLDRLIEDRNERS